MSTVLFDPAHGSDRSADLLARVQQAIAERTPLFIRGGASKTFYGRPVDAQPLDLAGHTGIVSYDPTELVITARAGTPCASCRPRWSVAGRCLPAKCRALATTPRSAACSLQACRARVAHGRVRYATSYWARA